MKDKGKGKRVTMRLTQELYDKVAETARDNFMELAAYIRQLVIKDVKKNKSK